MTRRHRAGWVPATLAATALLLAACSGDPDVPAALPDADPSSRVPTNADLSPAPEEPTYSPQPGEVVALPHGPHDWATLLQGRYAVRVNPTLGYELDVPDQWRALAGTYLNAPTDGHGIFLLAELPRHGTNLPVHPCDDHSLRLVGPTVDDFVRAFTHLPVWRTSAPRPVVLAGLPAVYLQVELPARVDPADCVDGAVSEYEAGRDGLATTRSFRSRWWILEVHGQRLVVMGRCYDTCDADDMDTLSAMAESLSFTRG